MNPETDHHPWCNFYFRPREDCRMCERFWKLYPIKSGDTADDLITRHFPNVEVVGGSVDS